MITASFSSLMSLAKMLEILIQKLPSEDFSLPGHFKCYSGLFSVKIMIKCDGNI